VLKVSRLLVLALAPMTPAIFLSIFNETCPESQGFKCNVMKWL
jgi:hypothetical protein